MSANTRPGSIIEITDIGPGSVWYDEYIGGGLPLVFRITPLSVVNKYGLTDIEPIDPTGERSGVTCIGSAKYKVLWY